MLIYGFKKDLWNKFIVGIPLPWLIDCYTS